MPYQLIGERVDLRLTAHILEAFRGGRRVASHARGHGRGEYVTDPHHRPRAHQRYLEWSPSRLIRWGTDVGPHTAQLVETILRERPHPEQGYRACLGILRLGKHYPAVRVEAAAARALAIQARSAAAACPRARPALLHRRREDALMLTQQTLETLRALGFTGMADAYQAQLQDADVQALSFDERLGLLVDREWSERQTRRLVRRLQIARLPLPAAIEDIDYTTPRGLERGLIRTLADGRWLHEHLNLIMCGPTGVGKTNVASALGNAACRQGFSVRYYRVSRLTGDLTLAKGDGSYPRLMRALAKTDLLMLDDWGLATLTASEARELLEVIDDRCTRRSTLIASQLPVDAWHSAIPDPSIADALLDRVVHTAHKIVLRGESMRKLQAKRRS